jgi:MerR family transcriptional regulator, Zn(II)-responsive regulator of zntA
MTGRNYLRSGELARLCGVSPDTLRYYERNGLLPQPARSPNRYRAYSPEALHRVQMIRSALSVGFTIHELREIFRIRNRGQNPCLKVREIARTKIQAIDTQIEELTRVKNELEQCSAEWDRLLSKVKPGERAHLLENLIQKERLHGSPFIPPGLKKRRIKHG